MIVGYTSNHTAMLDLDGLNIDDVKVVAYRMMHRFKLNGYLILKSSVDGWHVIFDKRLSWKNVLRVIFAVPPCRRRWHGHFSWAELQAIKGFATLRIGNKSHKRPPRIIESYGSQDGQIAEYLLCRKKLKM